MKARVFLDAKDVGDRYAGWREYADVHEPPAKRLSIPFIHPRDGFMRLEYTLCAVEHDVAIYL